MSFKNYWLNKLNEIFKSPGGSNLQGFFVVAYYKLIGIPNDPL